MLRLDKPGERLQPEILDLEQCTDLASRAFSNGERARLGQPLHPGGEVWGFADDPALLRRAGSDQITYDDEPGGNAETHVQRLRGCKPADRIYNRQSGAHRPL